MDYIASDQVSISGLPTFSVDYDVTRFGVTSNGAAIGGSSAVTFYVTSTGFIDLAAAFPVGSSIGPSTLGLQQFPLSYNYMSFTNFTPASTVGPWADGGIHYAGFRLLDGSKEYFGYVELQVFDAGTRPSITSHAIYVETISGRAIVVVPEPTGIALAAWCFAGGFFSRKRRQA